MILPVLSLIACDGLSPKAVLAVEMYGSFEAPEGADGNATPFRITTEITAIEVEFSEAGIVDLSEELPASIDVVDRRQKLVEIELGDYEDQSLVALRVQFAQTMTLQAKDLVIDVNLDEMNYTLDTTAVIGKARSEQIDIKLLWKNIILDATAKAPAIVLELVQ